MKEMRFYWRSAKFALVLPRLGMQEVPGILVLDTKWAQLQLDTHSQAHIRGTGASYIKAGRFGGCHREIVIPPDPLNYKAERSQLWLSGSWTDLAKSLAHRHCFMILSD